MDKKEILDKAINRLNGGTNWMEYDNIYPFTTENIGGYICDFNLPNNSLLTVGSSGDQMLNAILLGVNRITNVDINPFTSYYYYLKMAAILELSLCDFLNFFRYKNYPRVFKNNDLVFRTSSFNKIKDTLKAIDYDAYLFWDNLLDNYSPLMIRNRLFSNDEYPENIISKCNPYLCNDNTYQILKHKIEKVEPEFIICDINSVLLSEKYDNIWLSNILTNHYSIDVIKKIFLKFNEYLNENGMMLISYLYDTSINSKYLDNWADIYNLELVFDTLYNYNLELLTFTGVDGIKFNDYRFKQDSVLIYKR